MIAFLAVCLTLAAAGVPGGVLDRVQALRDRRRRSRPPVEQPPVDTADDDHPAPAGLDDDEAAFLARLSDRIADHPGRDAITSNGRYVADTLRRNTAAPDADLARAALILTIVARDTVKRSHCETCGLLTFTDAIAAAALDLAALDLESSPRP